MENPKLNALDVVFMEIDLEHPEVAEACKQVHGTADRRVLYPLTMGRIFIELSNLPLQFTYALNRVMLDEMNVWRLDLPEDGIVQSHTLDPYLTHPFVTSRINTIPLTPALPEAEAREMRFALHVDNLHSASLKAVYSGDLLQTAGKHGVIFGPTHMLLEVNPGHTLTLENIRLVRGSGFKNGGNHNMSSRCLYKIMDREEHPADQLCAPPPSWSPDFAGNVDADTLARDREQLQLASGSGYKVSTMTSESNHVRFGVELPAVPRDPEVLRTVAVKACSVLMGRLHKIKKVLEANSEEQFSLHAQIVVTPEEGKSKGEMTISQENNTMGMVVTRSMFHSHPKLDFVGYNAVPHNQNLKIIFRDNISAEDMPKAVAAAVEAAWRVYENIQKQLKTHVINVKTEYGCAKPKVRL